MEETTGRMARTTFDIRAAMGRRNPRTLPHRLQGAWDWWGGLRGWSFVPRSTPG